MGISFSHLIAIPCSLHILHWTDIYNFIYPHSASCPKFMLISSSVVTTFLAPVHTGISHYLLYSNCRKPFFFPSRIWDFWRFVAGYSVCYLYVGTGIYSTILIFALKKQSKTSIHFLQTIPNARSAARSLLSDLRKLFFSQKSNCLMLNTVLAVYTIWFCKDWSGPSLMSWLKQAKSQ